MTSIIKYVEPPKGTTPAMTAARATGAASTMTAARATGVARATGAMAARRATSAAEPTVNDLSLE